MLFPISGIMEVNWTVSIKSYLVLWVLCCSLSTNANKANDIRVVSLRSLWLQLGLCWLKSPHHFIVVVLKEIRTGCESIGIRVSSEKKDVIVRKTQEANIVTGRWAIKNSTEAEFSCWSYSFSNPLLLGTTILQLQTVLGCD